jgi:hypothetical protein
MVIIIIVSLKLVVFFFFFVDRRDASVCFMDNCAVRVDISY